MNPFESVREAMDAVAGNKLWAGLTILGVVIGVAAVVALMALGRGTQARITDQVRSLGTNLLFITPGAQRQQGNVVLSLGGAQTLTVEDARAIQSELGSSLVTGVAPERYVPSSQLIYAGSNAQTRVLAVTPEYQTVRNVRVARGEFLTSAHLDARSQVIVLGSEIARKLFGAEDPLGKSVRISLGGRSGSNFRVVGVLESKGGEGPFNPDEQAYLPLTAATRLTQAHSSRGGEIVHSIAVQVLSEGQLDEAMARIGLLLRERHRVTEADFTITSQRDFLATISQVSSSFTAFLAAIAGISLLVGGIGIMNIMLVSVSERTREIGIRKAIGARDRDILSQFMIEALVMSVAGGLAGIALGIGASRVVAQVGVGGQSYPSIVAPDAVALAFAVAAAVGLFFGIYPALRAARLSPMEALRHE